MFTGKGADTCYSTSKMEAHLRSAEEMVHVVTVFTVLLALPCRLSGNYYYYYYYYYK